ncbi:hypothetical protein DFJ73DRAFT_772022 [Zopfochytrium polystomum]|nr:hypothetical protein DFJ73DRAFT_772022 [Zopfochytrium polystomum]
MAVPTTSTTRTTTTGRAYKLEEADTPQRGVVATVASAAYRVGEMTITQVTPIAVGIKDLTFTTARLAKGVLDRYPLLKAFVYTLTATSAVPIATFVGFLAVTLAVCLSVAGTGVVLVQGGFTVVAGFVLFWFLAGAFVLTCIATFWLTAGYVAYQGAKAIDRASSQ